jgi:hypothetical protein
MLWPIRATDPSLPSCSPDADYTTQPGLAVGTLANLIKTPRLLNLGFFMDSMASAAWAKLLDGKLFGLALLVLTGHIVATFASVALKSDKISHLTHP